MTTRWRSWYLDAHRGNGVRGTLQRRFIPCTYSTFTTPRFIPDSFLVRSKNSRSRFRSRRAPADDAYLATLREELPAFLASIPRKPALAIYNAGTDVLAGDPLGRPRGVGRRYVVARDAMVLDTLSGQGIPAVIVTSGGYSSKSQELIAQLASTRDATAAGARLRRTVSGLRQSRHTRQHRFWPALAFPNRTHRRPFISACQAVETPEAARRFAAVNSYPQFRLCGIGA